MAGDIKLSINVATGAKPTYTLKTTCREWKDAEAETRATVSMMGV
jgi:hypothetical protein